LTLSLNYKYIRMECYKCKLLNHNTVDCIVSNDDLTELYKCYDAFIRLYKLMYKSYVGLLHEQRIIRNIVKSKRYCTDIINKYDNYYCDC
jgi:hypothetical protein